MVLSLPISLDVQLQCNPSVQSTLLVKWFICDLNTTGIRYMPHCSGWLHATGLTGAPQYPLFAPQSPVRIKIILL